MDTIALAERIVASHWKLEAHRAESTRTKAYALAKARLDGLLAAADALQISVYANAESGIVVDLRDILDELGPRPKYKVVDNAEQHAYDKRVATELVRRSFRCDTTE